MDDEEAAEEVGRRELAAEDSDASQGPMNGTDERRRVGDAQPGPRQEVVGQRVAREAFPTARSSRPTPMSQFELARLAERPGEEHPAQVERDGAPRTSAPSSDASGASGARFDLEAEAHHGVERARHRRALSGG